MRYEIWLALHKTSEPKCSQERLLLLGILSIIINKFYYYYLPGIQHLIYNPKYVLYLLYANLKQLLL